MSFEEITLFTDGLIFLLLFLAAVAVFVMALLADLVVQVTRPSHAVMPASTIVHTTTEDPPSP